MNPTIIFAHWVINHYVGCQIPKFVWLQCYSASK